MNPSRESEVGLGTAATKDERQEDGEEGARRRGGGRRRRPRRMASVRADADSVPRADDGGRVTKERGRALFARSLPSSLPPCSTDCNFQSSESKSGILSSPIESTNFEERKRGRKRKKGAAVVREEEEEEMGK